MVVPWSIKTPVLTAPKKNRLTRVISIPCVGYLHLPTLKDQPLAPPRVFLNLLRAGISKWRQFWRVNAVVRETEKINTFGCSRTFIGEGLGARKSMSNDTKDVEIISINLWPMTLGNWYEKNWRYFCHTQKPSLAPRMASNASKTVSLPSASHII